MSLLIGSVRCSAVSDCYRDPFAVHAGLLWLAHCQDVNESGPDAPSLGTGSRVIYPQLFVLAFACHKCRQGLQVICDKLQNR